MVIILSVWLTVRGKTVIQRGQRHIFRATQNNRRQSLLLPTHICAKYIEPDPFNYAGHFAPLVSESKGKFVLVAKKKITLTP